LLPESLFRAFFFCFSFSPGPPPYVKPSSQNTSLLVQIRSPLLHQNFLTGLFFSCKIFSESFCLEVPFPRALFPHGSSQRGRIGSEKEETNFFSLLQFAPPLFFPLVARPLRFRSGSKDGILSVSHFLSGGFGAISSFYILALVRMHSTLPIFFLPPDERL